MDSENSKVMSMRLSRVLGDIGVNRRMIARRRRTWLEIETIQSICTGESTVYNFGSQTEGTTTPGMQSDVDTLACFNNIPVVLDCSEWTKEKSHLLVIQTEESPPQHCWLQMGHAFPLPKLQDFVPRHVIDQAGRVFLTNDQGGIHQYFHELQGFGEVIKHGPSRSWDKDKDLVLAYRCVSLPKECTFLFQRPRPGHWPRRDTLAKAMGTGVFLVPQGYKESPSRPTKCRSSALHVNPCDPYYPRSKREWRFSTAMMERLMMFDMSTVQLKVYVLVKIIRKTFLKPIVGDSLSTFHMKTAMLYTIETYPLEIWGKDNLVQCVIFCLTTLRRWLNIKFCPHYTTAGVNLFTGKLFNHEINSIAVIISNMIASNLQCIYQIEMDSLGAKMSELSSNLRNGETMSRNRNNQIILSSLIENHFQTFHPTTKILNALEYDEFVHSLSQFIDKLFHISEQGNVLERHAVDVLIPHISCTLATSLASRNINQGQPVTQDIHSIYQLSLESDTLSSRLKFASMLYCSGQYEAAANCLTYCAGLLTPDLWHVNTYEVREYPEPNSVVLENALEQSNLKLLTKHIIVCIEFTRHEMHCIPQRLVLEMFRTITEEDRQQRRQIVKYEWMDLAVVDSIPFLHYLQFLTFIQINQHERGHASLLQLIMYAYNNIRYGHFETILNLLGHCWEKVNCLDAAWVSYRSSLRIHPQNNAARWHLARLLHQRINH